MILKHKSHMIGPVEWVYCARCDRDLPWDDKDLQYCWLQDRNGKVNLIPFCMDCSPGESIEHNPSEEHPMGVYVYDEISNLCYRELRRYLSAQGEWRDRRAVGKEVLIQEWSCEGCRSWFDQEEVNWALEDGTLCTSDGAPYCDECLPCDPDRKMDCGH